MLNKTLRILFIACIFLLGYFTSIVYPSLITGIDNSLNTYFIDMPKGIRAKEVNSPQDHISEEQIRVYNDRVIIMIEDPKWASFTDTNSMDPVIDYGSNAIEIIPDGTSDIQPGDIISYEIGYAEGAIIHRVTSTGYDEEGWYCKVKGDNNPFSDPGKVRFEQVRRVVVGIIY